MCKRARDVCERSRACEHADFCGVPKRVVWSPHGIILSWTPLNYGGHEKKDVVMEVLISLKRNTVEMANSELRNRKPSELLLN